MLAEIAFLVGVGQPAKPYFDEVHYVPAARLLLGPGPGVNLEHPPLAKALIASGMALLGDRPLGWRFMSTVFGSLALVGTYLWALALFADERAARWAAAVTFFNQVLYVQSRIAMLDVFSVAFTMWALAAFTASLRTGDDRRTHVLLASTGVFLGLACACKWPGLVVWGLVAGIAAVIRPPGIRAHHGIVYLGVIPFGAYYASFAVLGLNYLWPPAFLSAQTTIWHLNTLVGGPHPYVSTWLEWPVIARPIWYFFEASDWNTGRGSAQAVLFLGNPLVFWAGIAAVLACLYGWIADRRREAFLIFAAYAAFYLAWAVIPRKIVFAFYYFPAAMTLGCALAYLFYRTPLQRWAWLRRGFLALCAALFVYFLPISSAAVTVSESGMHWLMWFPGWR